MIRLVIVVDSISFQLPIAQLPISGCCCGCCCVEAVEDWALVKESVYQGVVVGEDLGAVFEEEPEEGGEAW